MKKKLLVVAVYAVVVAGAALAGITVIKLSRASNVVQAATIDKGADTVIVETMRGCIVTVTTQGLTDAGINQAYRLCWNRAELVGKTHKEK